MIAYFDLYSGASGDMILGALLDAGLDLSLLRDGLKVLPINGYTIEARPIMKGSVSATSFRVEVGTSLHSPRRLNDILALINGSSLPVAVRQRATDVFTLLGRSEAHIHRMPIEEVHFHEVGAVDAIVDVVGTFLALDLLNIDTVYASPFPIAHGSIQTRDGMLPLPAPATLDILATAHAPLSSPPSPVAAELVTPTGAALLCSIATFSQPSLVLHHVGYGAGDRDFPHPNVLRVYLGSPLPMQTSEYSIAGTQPSFIPEQDSGSGRESLVLLETNIDDMNPQVYSYLFERLFAAGALDVYCTPVVMKKGRPATLLSILCKPIYASQLEMLVLSETTTLGVRSHQIRRVVAERRVRVVETTLGSVHVKEKWVEGRRITITPEYEDCAALARQHDRPLVEVLELVRYAADVSEARSASVENVVED